MCDLEFEGRLDWSSESTPVARKARRCSVCRGRIEPGDRYLRINAKWEGDVFSDCCCAGCEKDLEEFSDAHHGRPFPSSFLDFLIDCIGGENDERWAPMLRRIYERAPRWVWADRLASLAEEA